MRQLGAGPMTLLLATLAYSAMYNVWVIVNHSKTGCYPYPFMDKLFATAKGQLIFVLVVTTAVCILAQMCRLLALGL